MLLVNHHFFPLKLHFCWVAIGPSPIFVQSQFQDRWLDIGIGETSDQESPLYPIGDETRLEYFIGDRWLDISHGIEDI